MKQIHSQQIAWLFGFGLLLTSLSSPGVCAQTPDTISISTLATTLSERWAQPATIVIRRRGGIRAVTVPLSFSGTATRSLDYATSAGASVTIPMGAREVWVQLRPLPDALTEPTETVQVTALPAAAYSLSGAKMVTINLLDDGSLPGDEEATRFLIQAGFGADPDELSDVKALGFAGWIDQQLTRPKGYLQPVLHARIADGSDVNTEAPKITLWNQVMRRRYPPGQPAVETDILRQRVAYSLLQIYVISQTMVELYLNPEPVTHYYDRLMDGASGNYRQLLVDVSLHLCMGQYLSHFQNRRANPATNRFPDENYAREIMQLFSIGLWELNQDGTRKLVNGQPIPTYTNRDIGEFARVFTGVNNGGPDNPGFGLGDLNYFYPMKIWDSEHDMKPKTLLRGLQLPDRSADSSATTVAGMLDFNAAIDNLFNHPNVGPFIGRQLIQRLVTSNPSPAYISRVAGVFANNGAGVRGDMGAVIKAILLDTEARSFEKTLDPTFGKMREPYLTQMNMAKTFTVKPAGGYYDSAQRLYPFFLQEPFQSPSVFNFYLPNYRPFGEMTSLGLYGPEFQILTAVTAVETQNMMLNAAEAEIVAVRSSPGNELPPDFSREIPLANDPDALIRQLATRMVAGQLTPRTFQIVREAVVGITTNNDGWQASRVKMAAYLIGASAEFNIQK